MAESGESGGGGTSSVQRVLIVDDHRTFAELLAVAIAAEDGLECAGTAADADEAVRKVIDLEPDIVVVDIEMPRQNGLVVTRQIRELRPSTVVIVVTAHQDPAWIVRATQAGATGFVPKNGSLTELLDAVHHARLGGVVVAPSALGGSDRPPAASPDPANRDRPAVRLTTREQDVLVCLSKGMPPKSIARVLGISVHTCRGYVKSVLTKLDANSQLEAVVTAQRLGIVPPQR